MGVDESVPAGKEKEASPTALAPLCEAWSLPCALPSCGIPPEQPCAWAKPRPVAGVQELVNAIIRPPRAEYEMAHLGPASFEFCDRRFRRVDFQVSEAALGRMHRCIPPPVPTAAHAALARFLG